MLHIFIVVDSGGNLLGTHLLGKACRDDICVLGLGRAYGYEKVSLGNSRLLENWYGGRVAVNGYHVGKF